MKLRQFNSPFIKTRFCSRPSASSKLTMLTCLPNNLPTCLLAHIYMYMVAAGQPACPPAFTFACPPAYACACLCLPSIDGFLPSKVLFHLRSASIRGHIPSKVIFHQRLYFIKCRLSSMAVLNARSSSFKDCLLSKVVFHLRLSSSKACLTFPDPEVYTISASFV